MKFETPTITLRYGNGEEATPAGREALLARRQDSTALPSMRDLVRLWPGFADAVCIFISGSVTQGWGHANSDVDFFVISESALVPDENILEIAHRAVATKNKDIAISVGQVSHFRADIELWTRDQVEEIVSWFTGPVRDQEAPELGKTEQDLIYRLTVGKAIVGDLLWADWRDRLLAGSYGKYLATSRKMSAEGMAEDVAGMLVSGDHRAAALAAHTGACLAVEGLLALRGDYCVNRKWLDRRLEQYATTDERMSLWNAVSMKGANEEPEQYARDTLTKIQRLIVSMEVR